MSPDDPVDSLLERRLIREDLQRKGAKGIRVDVADLCRCPRCGGDHYRPRTETDSRESKVK